QARSPRALRALRRRADLSNREKQNPFAMDAIRRRLSRSAAPRRHRARYGRDLLHHSKRARAAARLSADRRRIAAAVSTALLQRRRQRGSVALASRRHARRADAARAARVLSVSTVIPSREDGAESPASRRGRSKFAGDSWPRYAGPE